MYVKNSVKSLADLYLHLNAAARRGEPVIPDYSRLTTKVDNPYLTHDSADQTVEDYLADVAKYEQMDQEPIEKLFVRKTDEWTYRNTSIHHHEYFQFVEHGYLVSPCKNGKIAVARTYKYDLSLKGATEEPRDRVRLLLGRLWSKEGNVTLMVNSPVTVDKFFPRIAMLMWDMQMTTPGTKAYFIHQNKVYELEDMQLVQIKPTN